MSKIRPTEPPTVVDVSAEERRALQNQRQEVWDAVGKEMAAKGQRLAAAAPQMLQALMAAHLHLMVRPENRLAQADANVRAIVEAAIAEARGES